MSAAEPLSDIHRRVASQMTGKPESEVTAEERAAAKNLAFFDLYNHSPRSPLAPDSLTQKFIARFCRPQRKAEP